MCDVLKQEFSVKKFLFSHSRKEDFCTSQWKWHPSVYLFFRVFVLLYALAAYIAVITMWALTASEDTLNIMVFLTIWTFTVLLLHLIVALVVAVHHYVIHTSSSEPLGLNIAQAKIQPTKDVAPRTSFQNDKIFEVSGHNANNTTLSTANYSSQTKLTSTSETCVDVSITDVNDDVDTMAWYHKLSWFLSSVSHHFSIIVTLVYWCALFPTIGVQDNFINDVNMHAVNTVIVLLDIGISARPVRLLHTLYPFIYGLIYIVFSVTFWSFDKVGHVIYPILDWNKPALASGVVVGLGLIVIPLIQFLLFGLYRLRLMLLYNIESKSGEAGK